jgi:hypothetical protein
MGLVQVVLTEGTEKRLRLEAVRRLGGKKGDLSKAVEEAVLLWLKEGRSK